MKIIIKTITALLFAAIAASDEALAANNGPSLRGANNTRAEGRRQLQNNNNYVNPYDWLDQRSDHPDWGLSCVIRQANGANQGRVLTVTRQDVTLEPRNYNDINQRWIIHNRQDEGDASNVKDRNFLLWAQHPIGSNYLNTRANGDTSVYNLDEGNGRQRWSFDNTDQRFTHQFTISSPSDTLNDPDKKFLGNLNSGPSHVGLVGPGDVSDDEMSWELIDCYEIPAPRFFYIKHPLSNKVWDLHEGNCGTGVQVQRQDFILMHDQRETEGNNGNRNQHFFRGPNGAIMSRHCNRAVVAVHQASPFGDVDECPNIIQTATATGGDEQSWEWFPNGDQSDGFRGFLIWDQSCGNGIRPRAYVPQITVSGLSDEIEMIRDRAQNIFSRFRVDYL